MADENETGQAGHNGYDAAAMIEFIEQWEQEQEQKKQVDADAKKKKQPHVDKQKDIMKAAAEEGFAKKEFGTLLAIRKKLTEAALLAAGSKLNEDQQIVLDKMMAGLGSWFIQPFSTSPLGQLSTAAEELAQADAEDDDPEAAAIAKQKAEDAEAFDDAEAEAAAASEAAGA